MARSAPGFFGLLGRPWPPSAAVSGVCGRRGCGGPVGFSPASPPPLPPPLGARGEREAGFGVRAFAVAAVVAFGLLGCCRRPAALTHCSGAVKASLWRPAAAGERRPGLDCPTFFAAQGLTGPNICATMVVRGWLPGALHPSRKGVRGPEEEARTERFGLLFLPGLFASFGVSFSTAFPQSCCKATAFFRLTFPKKSTAPQKMRARFCDVWFSLIFGKKAGPQPCFLCKLLRSKTGPFYPVPSA